MPTQHSNEWLSGHHATLKAVADQLIPGDAWPSASETGVIGYLERRFREDDDTWTKLIEPGLHALDRLAMTLHSRPFVSLDATAQEALLRTIEQDHVTDWPGSANEWFRAMLTNVVEGYYGSPEAGGNEGAKSWEMLGFRPGTIHDEPPVSETELKTIRFDQLRDRYDAIIIGAGAGGSVAAAVLAEAGMHVLVVERGSWLQYDQVGRDHLRNHRLSRYGNNTGPAAAGHPRKLITVNGIEKIISSHEGDYHNNAMTVGGGTRVYGAQAWRFHPEDFRMASRYGVPEGSSLVDWPITYEELEPYYTRAEWEVGVAGDDAAHTGYVGRRQGYPMPPFPYTTEAKRLADAAAKLGWETGPVPLLINTVERDGRPACGRCGQCVGFACPTNSKNGGHNTMLVRALATGNCDLLCDTIAEQVIVENGKHATGVRLAHGRDGAITRKEVQASHIVVAAGAIESARLLLNSATDREPDGIGNNSGHVGRHLQGHVYVGAHGLFDEPMQDGLGPGVSISTLRFAHGNGDIIGGGLLANEFTKLPLIHWLGSLSPDAARWGMAGKHAMREGYQNTVHVQGPIQEIPVPDARVRVSRSLKDRYGLPVAKLSGGVHPESIRAGIMLAEQAELWLTTAGARQVWGSRPGIGLTAGQHQAGTLRMGNDPSHSVTDPTGRVHGYDNLWVADGSVHVTNGGVNPVLTIMALAFRTAAHLVKEA
ncbi:GMC family oxidoreductase [Paenibacillus sp. strain BS8-2]